MSRSSQDLWFIKIPRPQLSLYSYELSQAVRWGSEFSACVNCSKSTYYKVLVFNLETMDHSCLVHALEPYVSEQPYSEKPSGNGKISMLQHESSPRMCGNLWNMWIALVLNHTLKTQTKFDKCWCNNQLMRIVFLINPPLLQQIEPHCRPPMLITEKYNLN